jgi:hypothetical protein
LKLAFSLLIALCAPLHAEPVDVLFIGNSLTYANDLPTLVARLGEADGKVIRTETIAFPNFSLEDHLNDGRARAALKKRHWDFVVLQQGPSALEESRAALIRDTRRIAKIANAKVALLMVWPAKNNAHHFDRVEESYRLAAESVGGVFIPAGRAWRDAMRASPQLHLYGPDGFHPSPMGTEIAATAVYRALFRP